MNMIENERKVQGAHYAGAQPALAVAVYFIRGIAFRQSGPVTDSRRSYYTMAEAGPSTVAGRRQQRDLIA